MPDIQSTNDACKRESCAPFVDPRVDHGVPIETMLCMATSGSTSVAVIGAGVSGLACARRLREQLGQRPRLNVYEASAQAGGVTKSQSRDGFTLELGPDSMLSIKPAALKLLKELGFESSIQSTRPAARKSLIARGRQLVPVPEGVYLMAPGKMLPFAKSPLISWPGKIRMGLDLIKPRRAAGLPEESLADFVQRRLGSEGLDRLAQPLVGGIYTANPKRLSLKATMPQFVDMEQEHRSLILAMRARSKQQQSAAAAGPRYGLFVTLKEGLGAVTTRMADELKSICIIIAPSALAAATLLVVGPCIAMARSWTRSIIWCWPCLPIASRVCLMANNFYSRSWQGSPTRILPR